MSNYTIVVMSCDKNEDLWKPFYLCMDKYWKDHPTIIYSTETKTNPYYQTICRNYPIEKWTRRLWDTIKCVETKYVLLMCDDLFIRDYVCNTLIEVLCGYLVGGYVGLNMEKSFDPNDTPLNDKIMIRNQDGKWKTSVMCQLFQRQALLDMTNLDLDPWAYESLNNGKYYQFLISRYGDFINWGYKHKETKWFGIRKGKWCKECKVFFDKEGIVVDYSIRGFYE